MRIAQTTALALAVMMTAAVGCDDDEGNTAVDARPPVTTDAGTDRGPDAAAPNLDAPPAANLYMRLGAEPGIRTVITDFVVNRVLLDPKINGFFLNSSVDGGKLINCLVLQVGNLTGGPEVYPSAGCRDMKTSHAGLKISMQDFNDLAGHLVASLTAAGVPAADINTIVDAVAPMASDIVEDKTNNATVYQRVGRKPAIGTVIDNFIGRVVKDVRINGFFATTNAARLRTCLVRQVCSIDGPCKYGQEVAHPSEPGVSPAAVCKDMKSSHIGLTSPPGGAAGSKGITHADFGALVEDLILELDAAGVAAADKGAILGALGPMCDDIVAGGIGCPARTVVALTATNTLVSFDSKAPTAVSAPVAVTGLAAGEMLVGISFRPVGGKLYGLSTLSRLYDINRSTGAATAVGAAPFVPALAGTVFGFDFNPTVDRIRVVSDALQNLRLHPDMGTVAGTDMPLNPVGAAVSAVAYTGSVAGATKTTLYGIDVTSNKVVRQGGPDGAPSPNTGALTDIGALGVDPTGAAGLDIAMVKGADEAYAVLSVGGISGLYSVNLTTGAATAVGPVGGNPAVRAIAIAP